MMLMNKALRQGQTETAAPLSSGNQRVKHVFANIVRNPRTIVDDLQLER